MCVCVCVCVCSEVWSGAFVGDYVCVFDEECVFVCVCVCMYPCVCGCVYLYVCCGVSVFAGALRDGMVNLRVRVTDCSLQADFKLAFPLRLPALPTELS